MNMTKISAGFLPYKVINNELYFLLAHPGGPFFKNKDIGFWSIVKGEVESEENLLDTAVREFREETGLEPVKPFLELGNITQKSGKVVHAWGFKFDQDIKSFESNKIEIEWPPKSGNKINIPEIDRLEYFNFNVAILKVNQAQTELVRRLKSLLA
ncbi:MAG: NUDIX domain-containing protein [Opitutaceae bacterium]|nr:NUDIX domain-containing protein [Cytophagales bacterium]